MSNLVAKLNTVALTSICPLLTIKVPRKSFKDFFCFPDQNWWQLELFYIYLYGKMDKKVIKFVRKEIRF